MANEAVIIELLGEPKGCPVRYECGDSVGIEKGTLLWFGDARKVSGASVDGHGAAYPFAGIAAHEKVAGDGSTSIAVYTKGIFDLTTVAAPTVTAGDYVVISGANLVSTAHVSQRGNASSGANIVGVAQETASASEVIAVAVGVY